MSHRVIPIEALTLADRVLTRKDGRILQEGAPLTLYNELTTRFDALQHVLTSNALVTDAQ